MRTKELNIEGSKVEAVLLCGGPKFKVYCSVGIQGVIISRARNNKVILDGTRESSTVWRYVNIKYMPLTEHASIKDAFTALMEVI